MLSVRPHKSIRVNLRCRLTPPADSLKVLINPTILVHRFIFIVNIIFLKNYFVNTFFDLLFKFLNISKLKQRLIYDIINLLSSSYSRKEVYNSVYIYIIFIICRSKYSCLLYLQVVGQIVYKTANL